jgi:hypothetical protein
MTRPNRMTRKNAEAAGFTVDTSCYPWFAYRGPRFRPTEQADVFTDLEAELLGLQPPEETAVPVQSNLGPDRDLMVIDLVEEAKRIQAAVSEGVDSGPLMMALRDRMISEIKSSELLGSYQYAFTEYELVNSKVPRLSVVYQRRFGIHTRAFAAQIGFVVTADNVTAKAEVFHADVRPVALYDGDTHCEVTPPFMPMLFAGLVGTTLEESQEQIVHVANLEGLPVMKALYDTTD